jgi:cell division protein FtsI (penicillin-binding protein 3)
MNNLPKKEIKPLAKWLGGIFTWDRSSAAASFRVIIVLIGFALGFIVISGRLIYVASNNYIKQQQNMVSSSKFRKSIVDRNGHLLAVNLPAASLFANPKRVVDIDGSLRKLLKIFPNLSRDNILKELKSNKTFVWIKRDISPKEQEEIYNLGMPGFGFEREEKRVYTYGNLFAHLIGYVGRDMEGLAGVEKYFNEFLTDQNEQDSSQKSNLELSIDLRVQSILSEEMDHIIQKFSAKGAAGIVADPNTGEIIAIVSKPDFDPHHPGQSLPEQLFNNATQGIYEMGSGVKGLTIAIGLDTKATSLQDAYDLSYMKVGKFKLNDAHPSKGWNSVAEIFLNSSNIGVSQIILEIGRDNFRKYLKDLGLLSKLDIEVSERETPLFPPFSRWNDLSLVTMSYGYGISETPAHFIQAMIPLVNGGIKYPITFIKRDKTQPLEGTRVFSSQTSKDMLKLMRLVVAQGTGKKAEVPGYYIGGKTGTAEKLVNGKYDKKNKRMSSFFGVMPASNPKYVIYIIVDEPKGIKETHGFAGGGWVAAPVVKNVFERMGAIFSIQKIDPSDREVQELINVEYKVRDET